MTALCGCCSWASRGSGFSCCAARALKHSIVLSVVVEHGFYGMWNLPGPGIELVSPTLASGFFTTGPPGKPYTVIFQCIDLLLTLNTVSVGIVSVSIFCVHLIQRLLGAGVRHSTHGKGHEEGGSTYAKAGSSLRSPPGNPRASTPITRACLLYYFVLSPTPLSLQGAVPHHLFRRRS